MNIYQHRVLAGAWLRGLREFGVLSWNYSMSEVKAVISEGEYCDLNL